MGHSINGPSSLARRLACLKSRWVEQEAKAKMPRMSSEAADRGTAVHALIDLCLKTPTDLQTFAGEPWIGVTPPTEGRYTQHDVDCARDAVEEIYRWAAAAGSRVESEAEVDPGPLMQGRTDVKGRTDATIYGDNWIVNVDYKHGRTPVFPTTPQLLAYAGGALQKASPEVEDVICVIIQPNIDTEGARQWRVKVQEGDMPEGANDFGYEEGTSSMWVQYPRVWVEETLHGFASRLAEADDPDCEATAGEEQCRFCAGRYIGCKARADFYLEGLDEGLGVDIDDPGKFLHGVIESVAKVDTLSPEQVVVLLKAAPLIKSFFSSLEETAMLMHINSPLPGMTVEQGRMGNRAWVNEEFAVKKLSSITLDGNRPGVKGVTVQKPLTPAQMEKALRKLATSPAAKKRLEKIMEELVVRSPGKERLVPIDGDDHQPSPHELLTGGEPKTETEQKPTTVEIVLP